MNRTIKSIAVVAGIFFLGMITGLALPQFNIWPYSACHGLGGAIEITHYVRLMKMLSTKVAKLIALGAGFSIRWNGGT